MRAWRAVGGAVAAGVFVLVALFSGYLTYMAVTALNVPKPTIVGAQGGKSTATISWTLAQEDQAKASDIGHFVVYRSEQPGGPFQKIQDVQGATTYTDQALANGQPYYYAVTACDKRGNESKASEIKTVVPMIAPMGCRAVPGNKRISVTWFPAQVKNLKAYAVYRNGTLVQQTSATSIIDTAVQRGGRYVYTVRAVAVGDVQSGDSNRAAATAYETCPRCGGSGRITCTRCGGAGHISQTCPRCGGDGHCTTCGGYGGWYDWWGWWVTCGTCGGDGHCTRCGGDGRITSTCPTCNGRGQITCPRCNGTGRLT